MLKRMVDGKEVELTPQEEADTLAEWAANPPQPLVIVDRLQLCIDYIAAQPNASVEMISIASEAVQTQVQQATLLKG